MNRRILNKLAETEDSVKLVRENLPDTYEGFLSMSQLERDGIYKNIEFAIQSILDICALIVKDEDLQVPGSDEDILTELEEADIMKEEVIQVIRKMKGFRNFLFHRYGALDNEIAYHDIKTGLRDFSVVFKEIKNLIS
ncbi:MAG: DUF86 domain-containing protein [Theionarchaea archaeon]|nr:DUF86 domain-containing protein [Theionarchaea archaeon]